MDVEIDSTKVLQQRDIQHCTFIRFAQKPTTARIHHYVGREMHPFRRRVQQATQDGSFPELAQEQPVLEFPPKRNSPSKWISKLACVVPKLTLEDSFREQQHQQLFLFPTTSDGKPPSPASDTDSKSESRDANLVESTSSSSYYLTNSSSDTSGLPNSWESSYTYEEDEEEDPRSFEETASSLLQNPTLAQVLGIQPRHQPQDEPAPQEPRRHERTPSRGPDQDSVVPIPGPPDRPDRQDWNWLVEYSLQDRSDVYQEYAGRLERLENFLKSEYDTVLAEETVYMDTSALLKAAEEVLSASESVLNATSCEDSDDEEEDPHQVEQQREAWNSEFQMALVQVQSSHTDDGSMVVTPHEHVGEPQEEETSRVAEQRDAPESTEKRMVPLYDQNPPLRQEPTSPSATGEVCVSDRATKPTDRKPRNERLQALINRFERMSEDHETHSTPTTVPRRHRVQDDKSFHSLTLSVQQHQEMEEQVPLSLMQPELTTTKMTTENTIAPLWRSSHSDKDASPLAETSGSSASSVDDDSSTDCYGKLTEHRSIDLGESRPPIPGRHCDERHFI